MDTSNLRRLPLSGGIDPEERAGLQALGDSARSYLRDFSWCPHDFTLYLAYGLPEVIGLFLAEFDAPVGDSDRYLWVVAGDLPEAYFVTDDAQDTRAALLTYCALMQDWIEAVHRRGPMDEVFPVAAEPCDDNADLLQRRLDLLMLNVVPAL